MKMPRIRKSFLKNVQRGSSVMELCLVLPILLMLAFGVAEYGYFFYVKNTVQGVAQTAARSAITSSSTNSSVNTVISNMMNAANLQGSGYTVTFTPTDVSSASPGTTVTVQISVSWGNLGVHMLGSGMGAISNSKQVVGTASMVKEG
jgi:Flp pilus assembly protein TadG